MTVGAMLLTFAAFAGTVVAQSPSVTGVFINGTTIELTTTAQPQQTPGTLRGFTFVGQLLSAADVTYDANHLDSPCGSSYGDKTQALDKYHAALLWGTNELTAARDTYHANDVRIMVNEAYLAPSNGAYDKTGAYAAQIAAAVQTVRNLGMAAVVVMQWEHWDLACNGSKLDNGGIPGTETDAAWNTLLNAPGWTYDTDTGVVLEIYNEPELGSTCGTVDDWTGWQTNMQARIDNVRGLGSANVLLVPSIASDTVLDGTPNGGVAATDYLPSDPLITPMGMGPQLAYAVHPYPGPHMIRSQTCVSGGLTKHDFNQFFGNLAGQSGAFPAPIVLSEWGVTGNPVGPACYDANHQPATVPPGDPTPGSYSTRTIAQDLMAWLPTAAQGKNSSMSLLGAWQFDVKNYIVQDPADEKPTFFDGNFACNTLVDGYLNYKTYEGPGVALQTFFNTYR
jgi:hypothetical protein